MAKKSDNNNNEIYNYNDTEGYKSLEWFDYDKFSKILAYEFSEALKIDHRDEKGLNWALTDKQSAVTLEKMWETFKSIFKKLENNISLEEKVMKRAESEARKYNKSKGLGPEELRTSVYKMYLKILPDIVKNVMIKQDKLILNDPVTRQASKSYGINLNYSRNDIERIDSGYSQRQYKKEHGFLAPDILTSERGYRNIFENPLFYSSDVKFGGKWLGTKHVKKTVSYDKGKKKRREWVHKPNRGFVMLGGGTITKSGILLGAGSKDDDQGIIDMINIGGTYQQSNPYVEPLLGLPLKDIKGSTLTNALDVLNNTPMAPGMSASPMFGYSLPYPTTAHGASTGLGFSIDKEPSWLEKFTKKFLTKLFNRLKDLAFFKTLSKGASDFGKLILLSIASNKENNIIIRKLAMLGVALNLPEAVGDTINTAIGVAGGITAEKIVSWLFDKGKGYLKGGKGKGLFTLGNLGRTAGGIAIGLTAGGVSGLIKDSNMGDLGKGIGLTATHTLSGAGQGALYGASIASIFGPEAAPIGAAIGAGIGAIIGLLKGINDSVNVIKGTDDSWWDKFTGRNNRISNPLVPENLLPNVDPNEYNYPSSKSIKEQGLGHAAAMAYAANNPQLFARLTSSGKIKVFDEQFESDVPYVNPEFKKQLYKDLKSFKGLKKGQYIEITGATTTAGDYAKGLGPSHVSEAHELGYAGDYIVRNADRSSDVEMTRRVDKHLEETGKYVKTFVHDAGSGMHGHAEGIKKAEVDDGTNLAFSMMNTSFPKTLGIVYGIVA